MSRGKGKRKARQRARYRRDLRRAQASRSYLLRAGLYQAVVTKVCQVTPALVRVEMEIGKRKIVQLHNSLPDWDPPSDSVN